MATYKVIQDIEAEDKLLGPLTLRQFIYAAIVAVSGFICFKLIFSSVWWLTFLFIPHTVLFAMLAAPFGHDQPSEVWLLAKIRFFLKPRRRIWDQDGMKELVTINVPKRVEKQLTKNLTQTEVKSRLQALANTIDSRGWAVKNMDMAYNAPGYSQPFSSSDRLLDVATIPQEVPAYDTTGVSDMFDETTSATAQNLTMMMESSAKAHRQEIMSMMQQGGQAAVASGAATNSIKQKNGQSATPPPDYWFMNGSAGQTPPVQPGYATFDHNPVVAPGMEGTPQPTAYDTEQVSSEEEARLLEQIHAEKSRPNPMHSRIKTIQPLSRTPNGTYMPPASGGQSDDNSAGAAPAYVSQYQYDDPADNSQTTAATTSSAATTQNDQEEQTPVRDPAILMLASNDDLNVATLAREASKARQVELSSDDEVVISLH